jgi:DNA polymerase-4
MSVDEAYVDVGQWDGAESVARAVFEHVPAETGLPCSVGLATSKLVAKVASDFNKPRGSDHRAAGRTRRRFWPHCRRGLSGASARARPSGWPR